jgi:prepilin-type N-terminal cleavage/methylation domain-containing protein
METLVRQTRQKKKLNNRQGGFTLVELLVVMAIIAVISGALITLSENASSSQKQNTELANINMLKSAAMQFRRFRAQNGSAANLVSVTTLSSRNYNIAPLTTGTNQNAYGLTITIAGASSGPNFTITSDVGTATECAYFVEALAGGNDVATAPSCTGGTVSITYR